MGLNRILVDAAGIDCCCDEPDPEEEACCLEDDTCIDALPDDCSFQGGNAQGSGTTCATIECGGVLGNCEKCSDTISASGTATFPAFPDCSGGNFVVQFEDADGLVRPFGMGCSWFGKCIATITFPGGGSATDNAAFVEVQRGGGPHCNVPTGPLYWTVEIFATWGGLAWTAPGAIDSCPGGLYVPRLGVCCDCGCSGTATAG